MSDPSSLHKPYTTGAEPSTGAEKQNVHMTSGGWVRRIVATDFAWAGNDDTNSDPEVLVAFRGHQTHEGWYTYTYWVSGLAGYSAATFNAGGTISVHVHFSENVDVSTSGGTPLITIQNDQNGGGSAATLTANYASGSGSNYLTFTTPVGTSGQLAATNHLHIGANPININSGTIFEAGTSNAPTMTAASDKGYRGSYNKGGNINHLNATWEDGSRILVTA